MTFSPKLWAAIGGVLAFFVLLIALLATRATLAHVKGERDLAAAKLDVSIASVGRLERALDQVTDEQQLLAAGDAARMQASREALRLADAASTVRQAAIDKLMASAEVIRPEPAALPAACQFSEVAMENWK